MQQENNFYLDNTSKFKNKEVSSVLQTVCVKILAQKNIEDTLFNMNEVLGAIFYYQKLQDKIGINYLPPAFWKPLLDTNLDKQLTPSWVAGIEYMAKNNLSYTQKEELMRCNSISDIQNKAALKNTMKF